jgi:hypothetical protein
MNTRATEACQYTYLTCSILEILLDGAREFLQSVICIELRIGTACKAQESLPISSLLDGELRDVRLVLDPA